MVVNKSDDFFIPTMSDKAPSFFKDKEFACKDGCGTGKINPELVKMLNVARDYAGIPFVITSGLRCTAHNTAVGGVAASPHLSGLAVDIAATTGTQKYMIVKACIHAGFNRIGIGKTFVHVDIDDRSGKVQDTLWLY